MPWAARDKASVTVKIIDFGCAFRPGVDPFPSMDPGWPMGAPESLCAPETVLGILSHRRAGGVSPGLHHPAWSAKSDVWTMACTLFELHNGCTDSPPLFRAATAPSHFSEIARLLGPIPDAYVEALRAWSFDSSAALIESAEQPLESNWSALVADMVEMRELQGYRGSEEEESAQARLLLTLLRSMMKWDPDDRISCHDALASEFFHAPVCNACSLQVTATAADLTPR